LLRQKEGKTCQKRKKVVYYKDKLKAGGALVPRLPPPLFTRPFLKDESDEG